MQLLPPTRFRFCEEDREKYGDQWFEYNEAAIARLPVGEMVDIEREVGMSLPLVFHRVRGAYADGNLAATWVARRVAGVVEPFADYAPLVFLAEWDRAPAGDVDPPEGSASSSPEEAPTP